MNDETPLNTSGFEAIAQATKNLYPGQEGLYYGTIVPYALGGGDPLDGVEVWESSRGLPHWHYVTYGFTELYEKESEDPQESGYGFELTFRLARGPETQPPTWPIGLLQNLARYVFASGNRFGPGHHMSCNGPIALDSGTRLTALGFRMDPELGELDTPNGHLIFLQAVGLTEDEMDAMMCWNGTAFLREMEGHIPLCVTCLDRPSLMEEASFRQVWQAGMERDGSSTSFLYVQELETRLEQDRGWLRLGGGHGRILTNMLLARVGKGRALYLQGKGAAVFSPGSMAKAALEDGVLSIAIPPEALPELCAALQGHKGIYPLSELPLTVELVPTTITDRDGKVLEALQ